MARRKPLIDLDQASLDCMREVAKLAGVRSNQGTLPMRATIQITIREAMRRALPPDDPRKDPDFHPNHKD
jgi:hypothetical protein